MATSNAALKEDHLELCGESLQSDAGQDMHRRVQHHFAGTAGLLPQSMCQVSEVRGGAVCVRLWATGRGAAMDNCPCRCKLDGLVRAAENLWGKSACDTLDLVIMPASFPKECLACVSIALASPCVLQNMTSLAHFLTCAWFGFSCDETDRWLEHGFLLHSRRCLLATVQDEPTAVLEAYLTQQNGAKFSSQDAKPGEIGFAWLSMLKRLVGTGPEFDKWLASYALAHIVGPKATSKWCAEDMLSDCSEAFAGHESKILGYDGAAAGNTRQGEIGAPFEFLETYRSFAFEEIKSLTAPVDKVLHAWELMVPPEVGGNEDKISKLVIRTALHVKSRWNVYQVLYFLHCLDSTRAVYRESIVRMGDAYGFNTSANADMLVIWCRLLVRHNIQDKINVIKDFLQSQSIERYVLPVYQAIVDRAQHDLRWKWLAQDVWQETSDCLDDAVRSKAEDIMSAGHCFGAF